MKTRIAVFFGGCSSEYEVSLHSAAAVLRAINPARYELVQVGITRAGQWLYTDATPDEVETDRWHTAPGCVPAVLSPSREDRGLWLMRPEGCTLLPLDLCWPLLHGRQGEDGTLQGLLELAGLPFVGSGCLSSALCMDKEIAHNLALQAGIPCPRFVTVWQQGDIQRTARTVRENMAGIPLPWFVKPAAEGSSFGVTRVEEEAQLAPALENAFRYGPKVVVEEGIGGFEVGCAVLGNDEPMVGALDAIQLAGGFFDFHEKYTLESARILLPAPLDEDATRRAKDTALRLYRLFGCKDYARVDLFYTPGGALYFNEINTIPGMTAHSRYPGMLRTAGISFAEMVERMMQLEVQP